MDKKHILYITYDGLTDFLGQSQVLPYILGLEEKGCRFSILSYEKQDKFKSNKHIVEGLIANKNITWYPHKYHKRFSILATLWDILIGCMFMVKLHSKDKFIAVHCRSYISAIMGLLSKQTLHTKFIFDMRGFWADERVDGGLWSLKNPLFLAVYKFFKWIEKKCLLNADYVVCLTKNSYDEMQCWSFVTDKVKFKIIPCCVDLKLFSTHAIDAELLQNKIDELNIREKTVVSYLGSIGTWYMIDEMLQFFNQFKITFPNAVFLFITPEKEADILTIAQKYHLKKEDVRIVKAQRKEVPYYLSMSHFSLFFIKPSYSKKSSSPTKLAEIMAMGIPVICNSNVGDVEDQVIQAKAGFVLTEFEKVSYEKIVAEIKADLKSVYDKDVCLDFVNDNFSLNKGVELYAGIYSEVVGTSLTQSI